MFQIIIYVDKINEYLTKLVLQFVQKHSNICKMKEKQTPNGLRLLLTFENVKSIRKALELMEMVG
jgi:transcription-repair coupling factor (superfamily II helicase)